MTDIERDSKLIQIENDIQVFKEELDPNREGSLGCLFVQLCDKIAEGQPELKETVSGFKKRFFEIQRGTL